MKDDPDNNSTKRSNVHRALIFQGGGSLGAYEAGAYKAISEKLSVFLRKQQDRERKKEEPVIFHIVSRNINWCNKCGYLGKLRKGK